MAEYWNSGHTLTILFQYRSNIDGWFSSNIGRMLKLFFYIGIQHLAHSWVPQLLIHIENVFPISLQYWLNINGWFSANIGRMLNLFSYIGIHNLATVHDWVLQLLKHIENVFPISLQYWLNINGRFSANIGRILNLFSCIGIQLLAHGWILELLIQFDNVLPISPQYWVNIVGWFSANISRILNLFSYFGIQHLADSY